MAGELTGSSLGSLAVPGAALAQPQWPFPLTLLPVKLSP